MRKPLRYVGLAACLCAGLLLATTVAGNVQAADTTTTETTTETADGADDGHHDRNRRAHDHHRQIILPATTTSSSSESDEDTPTWVWVLLAILAVGLVAAIALLASRHSGGEAGGLAERATAAPRRCGRQLGGTGVGARESEHGHCGPAAIGRADDRRRRLGGTHLDAAVLASARVLRESG